MNAHHLRLVRSAVELPSLGWDRLPHKDFFTTEAGLRLMEDLFPGPAFYLAGLPSTTHQAGGVAGYLLDKNSPASPFTRVDRVLAGLVPGALDGGMLLSLLPSVLCGARHAGPGGLVLDSHESAARTRWSQLLLDRVEDEARRLGARTVSFLYVDDADPLGDVLRQRGWMHLQNRSWNILSVLWEDFDGYLRQFNSHRRASIRTERRRLRDFGVSTIVEDGLATVDLDRLAELELNVKARYGSPRSAEDLTRTLRLTIDSQADRAVLVRAVQGGTTMAFSLWIRWRDQLYARAVGFDYGFQAATRTALYFEVLFYVMAEWAPGVGVRTIHLGLESDASKQSRGCRGVPQSLYVTALDNESRSLMARASEVPAMPKAAPA